eukprot:TRINITY_DN14360_c0_g1_i1.p1 TRINITY_DN14360_c0_g1~~TRINITY_DN14360_c0_g1_i1.p1  ORF type:complete len:1345 (+),score=319.84 TRINITY_DN14360_c0_g1_i1:42-4037(+)
MAGGLKGGDMRPRADYAADDIRRHMSTKVVPSNHAGALSSFYAPSELNQRRIDFQLAKRTDAHSSIRSTLAPLNISKPRASDGRLERSSSWPEMGTVKQAAKLKLIGKGSQAGHHDTQAGADDLVRKEARGIGSTEAVKLTWDGVRGIGAGLSNMGNTCFLNSVLQCLTYTPPLVHFLLQTSQVHTPCALGTFCALCELRKHVARALEAPRGVVGPTALVRGMRSISRSFRVGRQEDAHEYMRHLLEAVHLACLPPAVAKNPSAAAKANSFVQRCFGGMLRSQVKCTVCSFCSNTYDPFLDLSADIHKAASVQKALQNFTAAEVLDGQNQYRCSHCKKKVRALKRLTIHVAPPVLTLQLKRFSAVSGAKIDRLVRFDPLLDLAPFVSKEQPQPQQQQIEKELPVGAGPFLYSLYGVLVHAGFSTHSGHYYCFVRTAANLWHAMDDSRVQQVSEETVLSQKAYILFYIRRSPPAQKATVPPPAPLTPSAAAPARVLPPTDASPQAKSAQEEPKNAKALSLANLPLQNGGLQSVQEDSTAGKLLSNGQLAGPEAPLPTLKRTSKQQQLLVPRMEMQLLGVQKRAEREVDGRRPSGAEEMKPAGTRLPAGGGAEQVAATPQARSEQAGSAKDARMAANGLPLAAKVDVDAGAAILRCRATSQAADTLDVGEPVVRRKGREAAKERAAAQHPSQNGAGKEEESDGPHAQNGSLGKRGGEGEESETSEDGVLAEADENEEEDEDSDVEDAPGEDSNSKRGDDAGPSGSGRGGEDVRSEASSSSSWWDDYYLRSAGKVWPKTPGKYMRMLLTMPKTRRYFWAFKTRRTEGVESLSRGRSGKSLRTQLLKELVEVGQVDVKNIVSAGVRRRTRVPDGAVSEGEGISGSEIAAEKREDGASDRVEAGEEGDGEAGRLRGEVPGKEERTAETPKKVARRERKERERLAAASTIRPTLSVQDAVPQVSSRKQLREQSLRARVADGNRMRAEAATTAEGEGQKGNLKRIPRGDLRDDPNLASTSALNGKERQKDDRETTGRRQGGGMDHIGKEENAESSHRSSLRDTVAVDRRREEDEAMLSVGDGEGQRDGGAEQPRANGIGKPFPVGVAKMVAKKAARVVNFQEETTQEGGRNGEKVDGWTIARSAEDCRPTMDAEGGEEGGEEEADEDDRRRGAGAGRETPGDGESSDLTEESGRERRQGRGTDEESGAGPSKHELGNGRASSQSRRLRGVEAVQAAMPASRGPPHATGLSVFQVPRWDDSAASAPALKVVEAFEEEKPRRRPRAYDEWDAELDRGRVKKVKAAKRETGAARGEAGIVGNLFQVTAGEKRQQQQQRAGK